MHVYWLTVACPPTNDLDGEAGLAAYDTGERKAMLHIGDTKVLSNVHEHPSSQALAALSRVGRDRNLAQGQKQIGGRVI